MWVWGLWSRCGIAEYRTLFSVGLWLWGPFPYGVWSSVAFWVPGVPFLVGFTPYTAPLPPFLPQLESSRRLSEIRVLHERSRSAAEEARRKEELYKQLVNLGGVLCF